jgi:drug/metabolite transporter (DMT)-like permease
MDNSALKKVQHAAGLCCLAAVVIIWVTSSEVIQFIFDNIDFSKPFFLTFYSTSLFSLYLFGFLLFPSWRSHPRSAIKIMILARCLVWTVINENDELFSSIVPNEFCMILVAGLSRA